MEKAPIKFDLTLKTKKLTKEVLNQVANNPTARILNIDELSLDVVKKYLESKHVTLWADWYLTSSSSMEKASTWLKDEIDQIYSFIRDLNS